MSSAPAGKFQDHYEVLGIEPNSDSATIQLAYAHLSEKYHPTNADYADPEKFEAVTAAYEVLSSPVLRHEFDKVKGVGDGAGPKFTGRPFFSSLNRDVGLRITLLCVLYDRRRQKPFTPSLSMRHVENIIETSNEELNLVVWYLKQRGFAESDDKSSLRITVDGMDYLEANPPQADVVMRYIKPTALLTPDDAPPVMTALPGDPGFRQGIGARLVGLLKNPVPPGEPRPKEAIS